MSTTNTNTGSSSSSSSNNNRNNNNKLGYKSNTGGNKSGYNNRSSSTTNLTSTSTPTSTSKSTSTSENASTLAVTPAPGSTGSPNTSPSPSPQKFLKKPGSEHGMSRQPKYQQQQQQITYGDGTNSSGIVQRLQDLSFVDDLDADVQHTPFSTIASYSMAEQMSAIMGQSATRTSGRPCVVGVIGDSSKGKHLFLNKLVNDSVFHIINLQPNNNNTNIIPEDTVKLEIYNDSAKDNVYINLNSVRDTKLLINAWELINIDNSNEVEKWLDDADFIYLKYLLFMFHICNVIFLVFENLTIKLEYFNVFKILKSVKQMASPSISNILSKQNIPQDLHPFLTPGRCIPILQVFMVKDLTDNYSREFTLKLEDGLKKQILTVLKNNGLFTSFSHFSNSKKDSSALFLIEMNRPLVRLIRLYQMYNTMTSSSSSSALSSSSSNIINNSNNLNTSSSNLSIPTLTTSSSSSLSISNDHQQQQQQQQVKPQSIQKQFRFFSQLMNVYESGYHNIPTACINSYKQSLANLQCELPKYEVWERVVVSLQSFFEQKDNVLVNLKNSLGVDTQFSTKNCQNYYKSALDQYLDGLPAAYGAKVHQSKLQRAIKTLSFYAAGTALDQFIANLTAECESYWKKGRKLCEAESITGRLCTHKTHPLPPKDGNSSTPADPDAKLHHSGFRTLGSCNCGKSIKLREDIFDPDYGNSEFFQQECCDAYQSLEVPVSTMYLVPASSITHKRVQSTGVPWISLLHHGKSSIYNPQVGVPADGYFVNNETVLQDWDFKRILSLWNNTPTASASTTTSNPNSSTSNALATNQISSAKYEVGKLSFEYQCPLGHRFYEKRRSRKFFVSCNTKNEFKIFYQRQLLESCSSSECDYLAQLMRVVMIPTADLSIQPNIEISQSNDKFANKWVFEIDSTLTLSKDQFYTLRLPYAYIFDSVNLLRTYSTGLLNLYIIFKPPVGAPLTPNSPTTPSSQ